MTEEQMQTATRLIEQSELAETFRRSLYADVEDWILEVLQEALAGYAKLDALDDQVDAFYKENKRLREAVGENEKMLDKIRGIVE